MTSRKEMIHALIMFLLTFGIGLIPPLGGDITPLGMKILGVFIGVLYGWSFLGFFWTSCFGMLALALAGYDTIWNILGVGFTNMMALQVILLLTLVAYLTESGVVEYIMGFFVSLKITCGRPFVMIFVLFFACGFVNMLGLGFGGVFFCWAIMYKMFDILGYKKGDLIITYMLFGAALSANLSTAVFPFTAFPILMKGLSSTVGHTIADIPWIIWNFLFVVLFFLAYTASGKYILRLDVTRFIEKADDLSSIYEGKKATKQQKLALVMMGIFLFVTLIPSFLPTGSTLYIFFSKFGIAGGLFLIVTITSVLHIDGKPVTNWSDNAKKGVDWDLTMMLVSTTPIANALESEQAGILSTLLSVMLPVLQNMSGHLFILTVFLFMLIVTQVAHNIVIIMALSPTLFAFASQMGTVNLTMLAVSIIVGATAAFLTPGASSPAAIVYSNTAYVNASHAYKVAILIVLCVCLSYFVLYPLGIIILK